MNRNDNSVTVAQFNADMSTNPMGDQHDVKKVGNYIAELYHNAVRRDNGVIQVYEYVGEESDHFRAWKNVAKKWCDSNESATMEFANLLDDNVSEFIEENPEE